MVGTSNLGSWNGHWLYYLGGLLSPMLICWDLPNLLGIMTTQKKGKLSTNEHFMGIILPRLLGMIITHSKELYQPTSIMGWDRGIL